MICSIFNVSYGNQYCGKRMIVKDDEQDGNSLEQEVTHG